MVSFATPDNIETTMQRIETKGGNILQSKTKIEADQLDYSVKHAQGFSIEVYKDFAIIEVKKPWPNSKQNYRYLVQYTSTHEQVKGNFDAVISTPISSYILSSTTHVPSAESLGVLRI